MYQSGKKAVKCMYVAHRLDLYHKRPKSLPESRLELEPMNSLTAPSRKLRPGQPAVTVAGVALSPPPEIAKLALKFDDIISPQTDNSKVTIAEFGINSK